MKKKVFLIIIIFLLLCGINFLKDNFNNPESLYVDNFTNNIENDKSLAFYLQEEVESENYINTSVFPSKDDGYIFSGYVCNDKSIISFDNNNWSIEISSIESSLSKCNLYFDINVAKTYILGQNEVNDGTPDLGVVATTNEGLFKTEDDYGETYYYRGNVNNNWFYFGGYYWRIVRINGDGTIRLIYQGSSIDDLGVDSQIATSTFNSNRGDNAYEGFMYGQTSQTDYTLTHANTNSSTIKEVLDEWYLNNLSSYAEYIDGSAGFCNDRKLGSSTQTNHGTTGYSTNATLYAPADRVWGSSWTPLSPQEPTLKCNQNIDLFTTTDATTGNKALTNPIGLLTVDEVIYAGAYYNEENTNFYLYTGQDYWVMSPGNYDGSGARVFKVTNTGTYGCEYVNVALGVRPVINLNADIVLDGTGTIIDPYVIFGTYTPEIGGAKGTILADKTVTTRNDFTVPVTADTTGTMYYATDDDGISYYFAGAPRDNWVKFGGFYWRIVRINGDGTIRLIYNGTGTATTAENTQIGTSTFSSAYNNNMYVGYMYTQNNAHGLGTNSSIKTEVDSWYKSYLINYADYLDTNAGFCNDRSAYLQSGTYPNYTYSEGGGTGTTQTYWGGYLRVYVYKQPTYSCKYSSDLFTLSTANKGNKALSYPVGLLTVDEAVYAGGVANSSGMDNTSYYLYSGTEDNLSYWTMTPGYTYHSPNVSAFSVSEYLFGSNNTVSVERGVRPVINLRADVTLTGSGTSTDPYLVS